MRFMAIVKATKDPKPAALAGVCVRRVAELPLFRGTN